MHSFEQKTFVKEFLKCSMVFAKVRIGNNVLRQEDKSGVHMESPSLAKASDHCKFDNEV